MDLTLDDIMAAPSDPDALNKHLMDRGLIAPPPPPPAPPTVAPMSSVSDPNGVQPMTKPHQLSPEESASLTIDANRKDKQWNVNDTSLGAAPEIGGTGPDTSGALQVKPMTLPTLTHQEKMALPQTSAGVPDIGSPEYTRNQLERLQEKKQNPLGSAENHPGTLGKIGHVLGRIGNTALDVVAPGIAMNIPGTDLANRGEENQLKRELTQRTAAVADQKTRDIQNAEGQARLSKLQSEQSLVKDAQDNIVGWNDPTGKMHSINEEGTPQAIKDIAAQSASKTEAPRFEKMDNGDIVQISMGPDGKAKGDVVYHGDPKIETDLTQKTVNGQEHHILIDKKTGRQIADLGAFKTETSPTQALANMKAGEELVLGYDKNNKMQLMSRADAKEAGLTNISKAESGAEEKAITHTTVLNTLQTQLNNVANASKALDQNITQRVIIAHALAHSSHSTIDELMRASALIPASEETKDYVQAVVALREAGLSLPKEITGGSRVSEVQASALWAGMPSAGSLDSKYAIKQAKKFQQDIDRLRQRAPGVRGVDVVDADDLIKSQQKEKSHPANNAQQPEVMKPPPAGKVSVISPDGKQHFVNEGAVNDFLKDPKYKDWKRASGR